MKKLIGLLLMMLFINTAFGQWKVRQLTDEFGELTDTVYLTSVDNTGSFINSRLVVSPLEAVIFYAENKLFITLYEYNNIPASFDYVIANMLVVDNDGMVHKIKVQQSSSSIFAYDEDAQNTLIELLTTNNEQLQCVFTEKHNTTAEGAIYVFNISTEHFSVLYSLIKN